MIDLQEASQFVDAHARLMDRRRFDVLRWALCWRSRSSTAWAPAFAVGAIPVEDGVEGEKIRPVELSHWPGRPLRELIAPAVTAEDLDRLAAEQRADGGWDVDSDSLRRRA
jgi:hypothetical protein